MNKKLIIPSLLVLIVAFSSCLFNSNPFEVLFDDPREAGVYQGIIGVTSGDEIHLINPDPSVGYLEQITNDGLSKVDFALRPSIEQALFIDDQQQLFVVNFFDKNPIILGSFVNVTAIDYFGIDDIFIIDEGELIEFKPDADDKVPEIDQADEDELISVGISSTSDIAYVLRKENQEYVLKVRLTTEESFEFQWATMINSPDWTQRNRIFTFSNDAGIFVWDLSGDLNDSPYRVTTDAATAYAINPNGTEIAYLKNDQIRIINLENERFTRTISDMPTGNHQTLDWK